METYIVSRDAYKRLLRKRLTILIPAMAVIMLGLIGLSLYTSRSSDGVYNAVSTPLILAVIGFIYYRSIRKQIQLVHSYSLTLSDSEITREQKSTPTITINFMEIKEIQKTNKGGFIIKGRTARDIIYVPNLMENAAELEQRLQAFAPVTPTGTRFSFPKYMALIYFAGIAAYITSITVQNVILSVLAGVVAFGILIVMFVSVRRSRNATKSMRRAGWIYLYFAVLILIAMCAKIVGYSIGR
jgi:hypothetical protein